MEIIGDLKFERVGDTLHGYAKVRGASGELLTVHAECSLPAVRQHVLTILKQIEATRPPEATGSAVGGFWQNYKQRLRAVIRYVARQRLTREIAKKVTSQVPGEQVSLEAAELAARLLAAAKSPVDNVRLRALGQLSQFTLMARAGDPNAARVLMLLRKLKAEADKVSLVPRNLLQQLTARGAVGDEITGPRVITSWQCLLKDRLGKLHPIKAARALQLMAADGPGLPTGTQLLIYALDNYGKRYPITLKKLVQLRNEALRRKQGQNLPPLAAPPADQTPEGAYDDTAAKADQGADTTAAPADQGADQPAPPAGNDVAQEAAQMAAAEPDSPMAERARMEAMQAQGQAIGAAIDAPQYGVETLDFARPDLNQDAPIDAAMYGPADVVDLPEIAGARDQLNR
jgi:hypothetical protein